MDDEVKEPQLPEEWTLENLRAHLRTGATHTGWSIHSVAKEAARRLGDRRKTPQRRLMEMDKSEYERMPDGEIYSRLRAFAVDLGDTEPNPLVMEAAERVRRLTDTEDEDG